MTVADTADKPLAHSVRRMLQALDAYWLVHCDGPGLGPQREKWRHPHGDNLMEHWWNRYERYRAEVEAEL